MGHNRWWDHGFAVFMVVGRLAGSGLGRPGRSGPEIRPPPTDNPAPPRPNFPARQPVLTHPVESVLSKPSRAFWGLRCPSDPPATHKTSCHASGSSTRNSRQRLGLSELSSSHSRLRPLLTSRTSAGRSKTPLPRSQNLAALSRPPDNGPNHQPRIQAAHRPQSGQGPAQACGPGRFKIPLAAPQDLLVKAYPLGI